ncbi:hypothetical protein TXYLGN1_25550 [Tepidimicrobium xylanilyticum]|uniref:Uncharacterized protein n=1 Tax=Tepidimicrobium xylanilyticum TaxID=1123352 RepID=A0A1H2RG11_9FIRM|nr:hypothetical protein EN5CB1_02620 [Tepidimicrobium xylanilyticum]SDW18327.1 hypothetical protein SAMN05660923_00368 [Tepidimicrobium xylanilyticum]
MFYTSLVPLYKIFNTNDIDLINLNKTPLNLQHNVVCASELLYCSNFLKQLGFKEIVFKLYKNFGITLKLSYGSFLKGMVKE